MLTTFLAQMGISEQESAIPALVSLLAVGLNGTKVYAAVALQYLAAIRDVNKVKTHYYTGPPIMGVNLMHLFQEHKQTKNRMCHALLTLYRDYPPRPANEIELLLSPSCT